MTQTEPDIAWMYLKLREEARLKGLLLATNSNTFTLYKETVYKETTHRITLDKTILNKREMLVGNMCTLQEVSVAIKVYKREVGD